MRCEMCGVEASLREAIVEGAVLSVCEKCSRFGIIIKKFDKEDHLVLTKKPVLVKKDEEIEFIVENYSSLIRKARERKMLRQEELAKLLAEKESIIHAVESGSRKPDFKLARKLEAFLGLKLIDKTEIKKEGKKNINFNDGKLTIGDLLKS